MGKGIGGKRHQQQREMKRPEVHGVCRSGMHMVKPPCGYVMSAGWLCVTARRQSYPCRIVGLAREGACRKLASSMMHTIKKHRILVVDDDPDLRDLLRDYLTANGFLVDTAGDSIEMQAAQQIAFPDAIVLDLMLPGEDGLSLTRNLRTISNVPILMLSARGEELDRVIGLEVGADDYMAKPFGPRELLARLRVLLRRGASATPPMEAVDTSPGFGPFQLDTLGHRLLRDGTEVPLTSAEYSLLAAFVAHPNRVLSRDMLVDLLRGYERDPFDRSIDNRVTRLRRKIEPEPSAPVYIRTVRGEGYLFNPRGDQP